MPLHPLGWNLTNSLDSLRRTFVETLNYPSQRSVHGNWATANYTNYSNMQQIFYSPGYVSLVRVRTMPTPFTIHTDEETSTPTLLTTLTLVNETCSNSTLATDSITAQL